MKRKVLIFALIQLLIVTFISICNAGEATSGSEKQKREAKPYSSFKEAPEVKAHLKKFQDKKAETRRKQKEFLDKVHKNGPQQFSSESVAVIDLIPSWEVECVGTCCTLMCVACIAECLGPEDFPCIIACCIVQDEWGVELCVEGCS